MPWFFKISHRNLREWPSFIFLMSWTILKMQLPHPLKKLTCNIRGLQDSWFDVSNLRKLAPVVKNSIGGRYRRIRAGPMFGFFHRGGSWSQCKTKVSVQRWAKIAWQPAKVWIGWQYTLISIREQMIFKSQMEWKSPLFCRQVFICMLTWNCFMLRQVFARLMKRSVNFAIL